MIYISEDEITSLLNWNDTIKALESAMTSVSTGRAILGQRVFSQIFNTPKWMITMPGYLDDEKHGAWACKVLSGSPENEKRPNPVHNLQANIMLFDQDTGALKAVLAGVQITNWRTAGATAVATKYLHSPSAKSQKILAIFGCGEQGRIHAECFYNCFEFEEIRLWNRTTQRATKLAEELNKRYNTTKFRVFEKNEDCARNADVIITTTAPSTAPIIKYAWLKKGVHINAVGVVGQTTKERHFELDEETYKHAHVYVDSWAGANRELTALKNYKADFKAEVGEVILGNIPTPNREQLTVFQSLGMAVEDCALARMVYDFHMQKPNKVIEKNPNNGI